MEEGHLEGQAVDTRWSRLCQGSPLMLIQICTLIQQKLSPLVTMECELAAAFIADQLRKCIAISLCSARAGHPLLQL